MAMHEPLNNELYKRLVRYYGDVEIVNQGMAMQWQLVSRLNDDGKSVPSREYSMQGEEYKVRCKRCRDHRARLYFNHRWGVWDPDTSSKNLWLVNCFNEDCYTEYEDQAQLYESIYALPRNTRVKQQINPGKAYSTADAYAEKPPPGPMIRLDKLAATNPTHEAVIYMAERGFDPDKLGRMWGVSYCPRSDYKWAERRLIVPVYHNKVMVGWQARHIGDDYHGVPFNEAGVPKYWTCPGFKKAIVGYNFSRAIQHPTLVVVEGVTDVWNVGPMGLGVLGSSMHPHLRKKLAHMHTKNFPYGTVIIALDPKQSEKDKKKGKEHHITQLQNQLLTIMGGRVVPLWLPEEFDPGSIDRHVFRELCYEAADEYNLKISFARPK